MVNIYYKTFFVTPDTLDIENKMNDFIKNHIILKSSREIINNEKIIYSFEFTDYNSISGNVESSINGRKKGRSYFDELDYLNYLNNIQSGYYRYAKDIRNLISTIINVTSVNIMTNYMIFLTAKNEQDTTLESLKKNKYIPSIFFEKLGEFYNILYNENIKTLELYKQRNDIGSKLSRDKDVVNSYRDKFDNLKGCYKDYVMPQELKQLNILNDPDNKENNTELLPNIFEDKHEEQSLNSSTNNLIPHENSKLDKNGSLENTSKNIFA